MFLNYGVISLAGIALLPRLSTTLAPLNFILAGVEFAAFLTVVLLDRCYPPMSAQHKALLGPTNGRVN